MNFYCMFIGTTVGWPHLCQWKKNLSYIQVPRIPTNPMDTILWPISVYPTLSPVSTPLTTVPPVKAPLFHSLVLWPPLPGRSKMPSLKPNNLAMDPQAFCSSQTLSSPKSSSGPMALQFSCPKFLFARETEDLSVQYVFCVHGKTCCQGI